MRVNVDQGEVNGLLDDIALEWVTEVAELLPHEMDAEAPEGHSRMDRPDRGGHLSHSHEAEIAGTRRRPKVIVTAKTLDAIGGSYSYIVHEGRGPVDPVDAPKLRWFENWDEEHTASHVGPAEPDHWMVRALIESGFSWVHHVSGGRTVV